MSTPHIPADTSPNPSPRRGRSRDKAKGILEEKTSERGKGWLKDIDLSRTAENILVGLILFFGRYPATFFHVLFRPAALYDALLFDARYKNDAQVRFTRPVTFLVVSGFVYLSFALTALGTFLPAEFLIEPLQVLIDNMPKSMGDLNLEKITAFMIPFVLAVGLYAYIATLIFRLARAPVPFKIHLNICSYIVGSVAVVLVIATIATTHAWNLVFSDTRSVIRSVPLVAAAVTLWALLASSLFRYLQFTRRAARVSWLKTSLCSLISVGTFYAVALGLVLALTPLISQLK